MVEYRTCSKCGETKELNKDNFYWRSDYKKFRNDCKNCISAKAKINRIENGDIIRQRERKYKNNKKLSKIINKNCERCNINFTALINSNNIYCTECKKIILKENRRKNDRERYYKSRPDTKNCIKCDNVFSSSNRSKYCEFCIKIIKKEYYTEWVKNNNDKIRANSKKNYKKNRDKILKKARDTSKTPEQREKNRIKNKKYRQKNGDPRKKNINLKIHNSISNAVRYTLNKGGVKKNNRSILKYLPYTINDLKEYLESQFESWMNWENWGVYDPDTWDDNDASTWTWQIDHIIPRVLLPYINMNFKKCWALSNLRPLSAKQNLLDGCNRTREKAS